MLDNQISSFDPAWVLRNLKKSSEPFDRNGLFACDCEAYVKKTSNENCFHETQLHMEINHMCFICTRVSFSYHMWFNSFLFALKNNSHHFHTKFTHLMCKMTQT